MEGRASIEQQAMSCEDSDEFSDDSSSSPGDDEKKLPAKMTLVSTDKIEDSDESSNDSSSISLDDDKKLPAKMSLVSSEKMGTLSSVLEETLHPSIKRVEAEKILKEYTCSNENSEEREEPNIHYLIEVLNDWKPRTDILGLYVRWSKRPVKNFHTDSIATLLCLANQCHLAPQKYLRDTKTVTVTKTNKLYGILFNFHSRGSKSVNLRTLNDRFAGLTLALDVLLNDAKLSGTQKRTNNTALSHKMERDIQHRWLALQVVECLFPTPLATATTEKGSLLFSFSMSETSGPKSV
jgi:hypothetical protein